MGCPKDIALLSKLIIIIIIITKGAVYFKCPNVAKYNGKHNIGVTLYLRLMLASGAPIPILVTDEYP